jgi:putative membrane protein
MFGGGMLIGWIWMGMLFFIPLFVIFYLLKLLFSKNMGDRSKKEIPDIPTPLDILKGSYARGEISREEFLQKRNDILEK